MPSGLLWCSHLSQSCIFVTAIHEHLLPLNPGFVLEFLCTRKGSASSYTTKCRYGLVFTFSWLYGAPRHFYVARGK